MKKSWMILLMILLAISMVSAAAGEDPVTYQVDAGAMTVTGLTSGYTGSLTIPETVDGYPVTKIGAEAFKNQTGLTDIILPDGIKEIGENAFSGCTGLEEIILPPSVTIVEEGVFEGCSSLSSVEIPDDVTLISKAAFKNCGALKMMTPFSVTHVTGVALDQTELTVEMGESAALTATVSPSGADNKILIWTTDDKDIATVKAGVVTGVSVGETTIRCISADNSERSAACVVTVTKPSLQALTADDLTLTLDTASAKITVSAEPSDAEFTLTMVSGNEAVVTVFRDEDGWYAVPESMGTTTVTVTADNDVTTSFTVTVTACEVHALRLNAAVPATCQQEGSNAYYVCEHCGEVFRDENGTVPTTIGAEILPKNDHTFGDTAEAGQDATCTEDGWHAYWQCTACGTVFADRGGVPDLDGTAYDDAAAWKAGDGLIPAGHTLALREGANATCTENGWNPYWVCSGTCGKVYADDGGKADLTAVYDSEEAWKTSEAGLIHAGHTLALREGADATCTADGWHPYWVCSGTCGKVYADDEGKADLTKAYDSEEAWKTSEAGRIPAAHTPLTKYDGQNATCTAVGWHAYWICSGTCGKVYADKDGEADLSKPYDDADDWKNGDGKLTALGHDFEHGTVIEDVAASCTEDGHKTVQCSRCDATETTTYPAQGHDFEHGTVIEDVAASCTEDGHKTVQCSRCSVTDETTYPAQGHDFEHGTVIEDVAASCTEDGHKTVQCSRCSVTDETPYPALGHDFEHGTVIEDVAASCTEGGHKTIQCSRCSVTDETPYPALGHDFEHGTVIEHTDATCTAEGEETVKCSRCEETQKMVLPALGHDLVITAHQDATLNKSGKETVKCSRDKCEFTQTTTTPAGVTWGKLTCVLSSSGVLKITGTGAMPDATSAKTPAPWASDEYIGLVKSVSIAKGITTIGKGAFSGCVNLTKVTVPTTVTTIGSKAFANCTSLNSITLGTTVTSIASDAFAGHSASLKITAKEGSAADQFAQKQGITNPNVIRITAVKLNKTSTTLYERKDTNNRDTLQLKATITPSNATNRQVTWKSSAPKVAKVDSNGLVTALTKGTATITATVKDGIKTWTKTCKITVGKVTKKITKITAKPTTLTLRKGKTGSVALTFAPKTVYNNKVKWTTSDKTIATVSTAGVITAKKAGKCTITATATDGSGKKVTIKVTVK